MTPTSYFFEEDALITEKQDCPQLSHNKSKWNESKAFYVEKYNL